MSDLVLVLTAALSVLVILLIGLIVWKGKSTTGSSSEKKKPAAVAVSREDGPRRVVRQRVSKKDVQNSDDDDYDTLADEIAMPEGKIGAKKRAKLEAKAAKRQEREAELQEREEKKERQAQLDEERKKKEEQLAAEEKEREEEEKRIREEKERQELEEYLAMKASFEVAEEGFENKENEEDEKSNKLLMFINYVKEKKVVLLEDLAAHFKMKTQDVINRLQDLLATQVLVGVIDDRGKFIYISMDELESVAKFIRRRGRVSISDLVENSNQLINLKQEAAIASQI